MSTSVTHTTLTPPSSSHGPKATSRGDWDFSVPLNPTTSYEDSANLRSYINDASRINGYSHNDYPAASKAHMMQNAGSTTNRDSLYDRYGNRDSTAGGASYRYTNGYSRNSSEYVHDSDPEASKWIHRDKLARIEGNEAADYLYDVESSRWIHKDKLERIEIDELQRAGLCLPVVTSRSHHNDSDHKNASTYPVPSPASMEEDYNDMDPRTPEEQAAERAMLYNSSRRNASSSRIPLAHSSSKPVPQEVLERTCPLPRQTATPHGSEDGRGSITYPARKRSFSAGSAMLLDTSDSSATQSTPTPAAGKVTNPKTRATGSTATGSKNAGSRTGTMRTKARTKSNPQLHRPTTSASYSTHGNLGTPNKSPEGIPPWEVNKTYKPDPRLPQDQQIIPTVAKRMQQEQWERDGVAASVYDRELRPLKVEEKASAEVAAARQSIQQEDGIEWPLQSPANSAQSSPKRDESPRTVSGGYSTMPPATKTPTAPTAESNPPPQIQRMPTSNDVEPKGKLCCCTIM